ncbi:MAG: chemotaxis protein MotB [Clostridiales bacterium]|nr:MAG: chemotaxis protein MotB [Clostridiales bacterium]
MKKRKNEEDDEKENGERWLLTYSDLITLLLALFIILYAMSSIDVEKFKALAQNLNTAFNTNTSIGTGTGTGDGTGSGDGNIDDSNIVFGEGNYVVTAVSPLDEIYTELNDYIEVNDLDSEIILEKTDTYILISLKEVLLFAPDSPVMLEASKPALSEITKALSNVYEKIDSISIEGHTADVGRGSTIGEWELSTNRAVTVLKYMKDQGLSDNKFSITGHSHFDPVDSNDTEAGKAKNRRVEITIFKASVTDSGDPASSNSTSAEDEITGQ